MSKRTFIIILISFFLFSLSSRALAIGRTEIQYPRLPGDVVLLPAETLPLLSDYIIYVFHFAILVSGLIIFGALIYAGVRYLTSAGNPTALSDAKDQILAGFLGLIVLFSSYLILTTINPQLVLLDLGIETRWGIVIYKEADCPVGGEEESFLETSKSIDNLGDFNFEANEIKSIEFKSPRGTLDVLLYPMSLYTPADGFIRVRSEEAEEITQNGIKKRCITLSDIEVRSIKLEWKLPGVYLINEEGEEKFLPASTALLERGFNDNIAHLRLNSQDELKFGVVLHNAQDYGKECRVIVPEGYPFTSNDIGENPHRPIGIVSQEDENKIVDLNALVDMGALGVSSATVFTPVKKDQALGLGVILCDKDNFGEKCYGPYGPGIYSFVNEEEIGIPNDSITSIKIDGNYLVVLFDGAFNENSRDAITNLCQVFTRSNANLRNEPIGRCNCGPFGWGCRDCLSSFIVIPTK